MVVSVVRRHSCDSQPCHFALTRNSLCFLFTINYVGFCQRTNRQRANHTVSEERGGDYRAMASSQGVLSEGEKREKEGGF